MKPHRSLLSLVAFCATSSLVAALGLAVLFASVTVAFAVARTLGSPDIEVMASAPEPTAAEPSVAGNPTNISGVITDDRCGARHDMGSDKTSSECARTCVHDGSHFALIAGDRMYKLDGHQDDLAHFAGQRTNISGDLLGDTIKVNSITSQ